MELIHSPFQERERRLGRAPTAPPLSFDAAILIRELKITVGQNSQHPVQGLIFLGLRQK
jgi:hypothetical protein